MPVDKKRSIRQYGGGPELSFDLDGGREGDGGLDGLDGVKKLVDDILTLNLEAVADSVGGATRRRGSEATEAVHQDQGARVPQRL